jgi:hypothetical protein
MLGKLGDQPSPAVKRRGRAAPSKAIHAFVRVEIVLAAFTHDLRDRG